MAKRKRKYRLKSGFKRFLVVLLLIICVSIYAIKESHSLYLHYEYQKTNEYKFKYIGYNDQDIQVFNTLPQDKIDYLLKNPYSDIYYNIVTQKYYLDKNFNKYIEYKNKYPNSEYKDIIALVNVHASNKWYSEEYNTDTSLEYLILVNKFYRLDMDYIRNDITNINLKYAYADQSASLTVIEAFDQMWNDVKNELNVHLMVNSSYRSYETQQLVYDDFKKVSQKYADDYAARPGHSEHQTGLAIDIASLEHPREKEFSVSLEYEWLKQNAHKYGFILRYPEGKQNLTGYETESWHFRYVGVDIAKQIYEENITFDEYYAYYIEK